MSDCFKPGCVTGNGVERFFLTVNQRLPGPIIDVCKNDRIIVDVTNHLDGQGMAFHWQGMHQQQTPWNDGVPMVTQCPINSGTTFRYSFRATDVGTHVWHAQSGSRRSNGLVGMLIVRDPNDTHANAYDHDLAEHSILLMDWTNEMSEYLRNVSALPDSILINGFGNYLNPKTGQYSYAPTAAFYVERGKKHRLRFANAGSHSCPFEIMVNGSI